MVFGICVAAIAVGTALYMYGPDEFRDNPLPENTEASALGADVAEEIAFTVLAKGQDAQVLERKNFAVYTQQDYASLWAMAYGDEAAERPVVDFSSSYVIGVFAGRKPSGGYDIGVSRVTDENAVRTVGITLTSPGAGCVTTQALTSPFELIVLPLSDRALAKADEAVTAPCE